MIPRISVATLLAAITLLPTSVHALEQPDCARLESWAAGFATPDTLTLAPKVELSAQLGDDKTVPLFGVIIGDRGVIIGDRPRFLREPNGDGFIFHHHQLGDPMVRFDNRTVSLKFRALQSRLANDRQQSARSYLFMIRHRYRYRASRDFPLQDYMTSFSSDFLKAVFCQDLAYLPAREHLQVNQPRPPHE
jgi:hypothetical protein